MARLSERMRAAGTDFVRSAPGLVPGWMVNAGIAGWAFIGISGGLLIIAAFLGAT